MNELEAVSITRYVKALCPHQKFDEFTADAWFDVLGPYGFDDCKQAAAAIAGRQAFISTSDIVAEVRRIRAKRLDGFVYVPGDGDGDPQVYLARRRAQIELVASGRRAADPEKALTAGADQVVVGELVAGVGQPVPEEST
ncbi:hypothetical protein [Streptodolium elevatio]|uniref:Uncharacterized protein n=1 Tax=Streptodolium elevatio TaxID=3157996 RepID=A0ABV3DJY4_9ACTN